jgi:ABC-type uncharacterized transport system YnjBCD substrate-binding protein
MFPGSYISQLIQIYPNASRLDLLYNAFMKKKFAAILVIVVTLAFICNVLTAQVPQVPISGSSLQQFAQLSPLRILSARPAMGFAPPVQTDR